MDPRTKIRNIELVRTSDPDYRTFVEDVRLYKMRLKVEKMERSYSNLVAQQFEIAIRGWLVPVGGQEERVISYEQRGRNKRYTKRFRELDFIIDDGDCLYIGELKVSSSSKRLGRA